MKLPGEEELYKEDFLATGVNSGGSRMRQGGVSGGRGPHQGGPRLVRDGKSGDNGMGNVGNDGLNPNRQKGFNWQPGQRIETPTLNDMKVKQGAIIRKFMNFSH